MNCKHPPILTTKYRFGMNKANRKDDVIDKIFQSILSMKNDRQNDGWGITKYLGYFLIWDKNRKLMLMINKKRVEIKLMMMIVFGELYFVYFGYWCIFCLTAILLLLFYFQTTTNKLFINSNIILLPISKPKPISIFTSYSNPPLKYFNSCKHLQEHELFY